MTCPNCSANVDGLETLHDLAPCPSCARTLFIRGDFVRLATAIDTVGLSDAVRLQLKQMRPKAWRDERQAQMAQIKARSGRGR